MRHENDFRIFDIDGKYYAVEMCDEYQVLSIGSDNPPEGGRWTAPATDAGIKYVATPCPTRAAARARIRRHRAKYEV